MPHAGGAPGGSAPPGPTPRILVLNPGSSSLKASLVELPERTLGRTEVSWGDDASRDQGRAAGLAEALRAIEPGARAGRAGSLERSGAARRSGAVDAVGYRVVHGGARFVAPARIDREVLEAIRRVSDLAPLHNDVALETIEAGLELLPDLAHVACFDTAFHATLDEAAYRYPVPESWYRDHGIRRFGFHGLSVAWSVRRAAALLGRDVADLGIVVAHLGSGCSVTAVEGGRSVDTSMGLTPLEGLMMGTRSGSIDPGVPLHLVGRGLASPTDIADALDHASGLLGVSGRTSDMRVLLPAAEAGDARAELAIAMFVRRAAAWIAAVATSLRRLDAIVFTGGIGEHAGPVRRAIVGRLGSLRVAPLPEPDGDDEAVSDASISAPGARPAVLVVEAREDLVIAAETAAALSDP